MDIKLRPDAVMVTKPVFNFPKFCEFIRNHTELDPTNSINPEEFNKFNHNDIIPMMAGKLCYLSFESGKGRNSARDHVGNMIKHKHGSVLEHTNIGFILMTSRDITHEIVRHRIASYSQLSQRYVNFPQYLMPPEFKGLYSTTDNDGVRIKTSEGDIYCYNDSPVHKWYKSIEFANDTYENLAKDLGNLLDVGKISKTDARKLVNQTARSVLPNSTITYLFMTTNIRSWRQILEKRCNRHAAVGIRMLFNKVYDLIVNEAPACFQDYTKEMLDDGTFEIASNTMAI